MKGQSLNLQRRVMIALSLLVALFVGMQSCLAYLALAEQEDDIVDQLVLAETQRLSGRILNEENGAMELLHLPLYFRGWLKVPGGPVFPEPLPPEMQLLGEGPHRLPGEIHAYVMDMPKGRLYIHYDAIQNEAKVHEFGYYLLGLDVLFILIGLALSWYVAAFVVAPIKRLTRLLYDWAPHSAVTGAVSDEEGRLLDAFSRVQARFEQVLADERAMVANMRHELRTPLTALRTDLEMLMMEIPQDVRLRLQRAISAADAMEGSIDLTRTSRIQREPAPPILLAACVDDAWASLGHLPEERGLTLHNTVAAGVWVHAERHALLTIIRNLMRNAMEHAAPAQFSVNFNEGMIVFADNGPGIDERDLPFIFERYYQGRRSDTRNMADSGNEGLGLAIARQVADLNGWQLAVSNVVPHGTKFTLYLTLD